MPQLQKQSSTGFVFCPPADTDTYKALPPRFDGPSKPDDPTRIIQVVLALTWAEATALVNAAKRRRTDWQAEVFPGDEALRMLKSCLEIKANGLPDELQQTKQPALTKEQIARLNKEAKLLAELIDTDSITDPFFSHISDYIFHLQSQALESKRLPKNIERRTKRAGDIPLGPENPLGFLSKSLILAGYRHWFAAVHY